MGNLVIGQAIPQDGIQSVGPSLKNEGFLDCVGNGTSFRYHHKTTRDAGNPFGNIPDIHTHDRATTSKGFLDNLG